MATQPFATPIRFERGARVATQPSTSASTLDKAGSAPAVSESKNPIYSHSRLSSFENCPKQFEYRYIQKIPSESEGVEAFVGKRVHEILERLYIFVGRGQLPGIEKVIDRYHKLWEETYDATRVRIVRENTPLTYYRRLGEDCIRGYYLKHYPFDESETLGIEKRVVFSLDDADEYRMQGIIDRISRARDGAIEVHDYKTGARVPSQRILDQDRQLALYQIGLARTYGSDVEYRLVWHYVAKKRMCVSTRNADQLVELRKNTIARIDEIQTATEYPARKIALCNWCEYKSRCPLHATPEMLAKIEAEEAVAAEEAARKKAEAEAQIDLL